MDEEKLWERCHGIKWNWCASAQILPKYVTELNQKEKVTVTNGNRERNQKKTSQIIQRLNTHGLAMRIRTTGASIHIEKFRSKKKLFLLRPRYVGIRKIVWKKLRHQTTKMERPKNSTWGIDKKASQNMDGTNSFGVHIVKPLKTKLRWYRRRGSVGAFVVVKVQLLPYDKLWTWPMQALK